MMSCLRFIKANGLNKLYLSSYLFKFEVKLLNYNCFLPIYEQDKYVQIQTEKLIKTIQEVDSRQQHKLKDFLKSYMRTWFNLIDRKKWNVFDRDVDLTNNSTESKNRYYKEALHSDFSIFNIIEVFKEQDAIASVTWDTMEHHQFSAKCFNKTSAKMRRKKQHRDEVRAIYQQIPPEKRDYAVQRHYLSQIILIFNDDLQQLQQYQPDFDSDDGESIDNKNISSDQYLQFIQSNIFKAYKIKYYPETNKYQSFFKIYLMNQILLHY